MHLRLSAPVPPARSQRARTVAKWFGLHAGRQSISRPIPDARHLLPQAGQITLVVGPSGSGKSTLLRNATQCKDYEHVCVNLDELVAPDVPLVDCFEELSLLDAMSALSRVGLADAWTFLRTPSELSDGQRWRLKLSLALDRARRVTNPLIVSDEFSGMLDRMTAMVVSRAFRGTIVAPLRALVATSNEDLFAALQPDLVVRCDFNSAIITRR